MAASAPEPSAASQPAAATASAEDAPYVKSLRAAMRNNAAVNFSKLACLATVTAQGLPSVRTVVVRAVEGQRVLIASDARSAKVADLRRSPLAELCWYFPLTREQFRLRGRVEVWGAESKEPAVQRALLEIWKKLPENTRGLTSLPAPGTVRPDRVGLGDLDKYEPQPVNPDRVAENFVVLALMPDSCDHLTVPSVPKEKTKPIHRESLPQPQRMQKRWFHERDPQTQQWTIKQLNF